MNENMNESQLKNERAKLLLILGEEAHSMIRRSETVMSDELKSISEQIQRVDVKISNLLNNQDSNTCPQCKSKIGISDAAFCTNCGFALKAYYSQFSGQCEFCGTNVTEAQAYCETCGSILKKY